MHVIRLPQFVKDLKRLKRFASLPKDIEVLCIALYVYPNGNGSKHWNCMHKNEKFAVYKVRLACASLKGETKMRVIYAYYATSERFDLIELYWKGEKENHDEDRLKEYLKTCCEEYN